MSRLRPLWTALALLAAVVAASPSSANAATPGAPTGVSLAPGVVERELPGRTVDLSFTVSNNEPHPVWVALSVSELGQTLDGAFTYGAPSPLKAEPTEVMLTPGHSAQVRVTGALPEGARAVYAGLLAEPRLAEVRPQAQVEVRTRLAGLLLLTTPGEHRRGVEVEDVTLTPARERDTYRVGAVLRNTGEIHVRPQGTVRISRPGGPELGTATLTGAVLLPGAARRLDGGVWTAPQEPTPRVQLDVAVTDPAAGGTRTIELPDWTDEAGAPPVVPGDDLGELGGDGPVGPAWLAWVALALMLLISALLVREQRLRHARREPA